MFMRLEQSSLLDTRCLRFPNMTVKYVQRNYRNLLRYRRERPFQGHSGRSRGRFYYRFTTFEGTGLGMLRPRRPCLTHLEPDGGEHSWHGGDAPDRGGRRWSGCPCAGRHEETPGADEGSGGLSRLGEGDADGEVGGMGAFAVRWYPPYIRGCGFDCITSRGACASRSASRPFSTRGGSRR